MGEFKEQGHYWPVFCQIWLHTSLKAAFQEEKAKLQTRVLTAMSLSSLCLAALDVLSDMSYSLSTHRCKNILYAESANDLTAPSLWRKKPQPLESPTAFFSYVINTGCV